MPNTDVVLIGLQVLLFSLAGVILRSYLNEKAKNLATKSDIEAITRQVETVKAGFRIAAHEHETRFARLHERRADAIDEVYKRLVRTHAAFLPLVGSVVPQDGPRAQSFDNQLKKAGSIALDLREFFIEHRLYFGRGIIATFDTLDAALRDAFVTFAHDRHDLLQSMPPMEYQRIVGAWSDAGQVVSATVPELLRQIELRMRQDLGAETPPDRSVRSAPAPTGDMHARSPANARSKQCGQ